MLYFSGRDKPGSSPELGLSHPFLAPSQEGPVCAQMSPIKLDRGVLPGSAPDEMDCQKGRRRELNCFGFGTQ